MGPEHPENDEELLVKLERTHVARKMEIVAQLYILQRPSVFDNLENDYRMNHGTISLNKMKKKIKINYHWI